MAFYYNFTTTTSVTYTGTNQYVINWTAQPAYREPPKPKEEYYATLVTDEDEDA